MTDADPRDADHPRLEAVHQFSAGAAPGDGVTNSMFFIRALLRELGYASEIYAGEIPKELTGELRSPLHYRSASGQILLQHHSMGHGWVDWVERVTDPRILVYHNITPAAFFPPGSPEHQEAQRGVSLLHRWAGSVDGAIALSPYNAQDLKAAGYRPITTLPLLVDLDRLQKRLTSYFPSRPLPHPLPEDRQDQPLLLFVGRIVANKRHDLLVDMLGHLRGLLSDSAPQLVLVGSVTDPTYANWLVARVNQLELDNQVIWAGKVSDAELRRLYNRANLFVCASDHEGFGMPLIEAQAFGIPVLARATSNVADTVGEGGVVIDSEDPRALAAVAVEMLQDDCLRTALQRGARRNLERFARPALRLALDRFLSERYRMAMAKRCPPALESSERGGGWINQAPTGDRPM